MIARTMLVVTIAMAFSQGAVLAVEGMVPLFTGEVYADGRPINRVVEVRLEAANSSLVANAYTFALFQVHIPQRHPGYGGKLLPGDQGISIGTPFRLHMNDFVPDSASSEYFISQVQSCLNCKACLRKRKQEIAENRSQGG